MHLNIVNYKFNDAFMMMFYRVDGPINTTDHYISIVMVDYVQQISSLLTHIQYLKNDDSRDYLSKNT